MVEAGAGAVLDQAVGSAGRGGVGRRDGCVVAGLSSIIDCINIFGAIRNEIALFVGPRGTTDSAEKVVN